jgi:hypothetical protein
MLVGASAALVGRAVTVVGPIVSPIVELRVGVSVATVGLRVLEVAGSLVGAIVGVSSPSLEGVASETGLDVGVPARISGLAEGLSEIVNRSNLAKPLAVLVLPDLIWTSTTATEVVVVTVAITAAAIANFTTTVSPVVPPADDAIVLAPAAAEAPATEAA